MIPNELIGDLSNVHLYEPHIKLAKEQLKRDPNKYSNISLVACEEALELLDSDKDLDSIINGLEIADFYLGNYESYPSIKAEMYEPRKQII